MRNKLALTGVSIFAIGVLTACGTVSHSSTSTSSSKSVSQTSTTSSKAALSSIVNQPTTRKIKQQQLPDVNTSKKGLYGELVVPVKPSWFTKLSQDSFLDVNDRPVKLPTNKNILFFASWNLQSQNEIKELVKHHLSNQYELVSTFWNFVTNAQGEITSQVTFRTAVTNTIHELTKLGVKNPQLLFTESNNTDVYGVPTLLIKRNGSWYVMNGAPSGNTTLWNEVF